MPAEAGVGYGPVRYAIPTTLVEALDLMSAFDAVPVAGGTDFYPARVGRAVDEPVVDLSKLSGLHGIEPAGDPIRIGALATWSEIAATDLPEGCRALRQAAVTVGGRQIQNVGTIGGNLCNSSPAADGIPPLLLLDAVVELASVAGTRNVPLADFILGYRRTALRPDELLTSVLIPREATAGRSVFLKLGSRRYLVISVVMVGARLVVADDGTIAAARVAVGACSPVAQRLEALEQDLVGVPASEVADRLDPRHFEDLSPIDDQRASAAYRQVAARAMVKRALDQCVAPG